MFELAPVLYDYKRKKGYKMGNDLNNLVGKFPRDLIKTIGEYKKEYNFGYDYEKEKWRKLNKHEKKEKVDIDNIAYLMQTNDFYAYLLENVDFTFISPVRSMLKKQMYINLASVFECILIRYPKILHSSYCSSCPAERARECAKRMTVTNSKNINGKSMFYNKIAPGDDNDNPEPDIVFGQDKKFYESLNQLFTLRNQIHLQDDSIVNNVYVQYDDKGTVEAFLINYKSYEGMLDTLMDSINASRSTHSNGTCFKAKA